MFILDAAFHRMEQAVANRIHCLRQLAVIPPEFFPVNLVLQITRSNLADPLQHLPPLHAVTDDKDRFHTAQQKEEQDARH